MIPAWSALSAEPYRLFFLAGATQAVLNMLLWTMLLSGRMTGIAPELPLPAGWLHAALMLFGTFPFFVTGFTLTAVPNWLGERGVARDAYLPAFMLMASGALLVYPALWIGSRALVAAFVLHGAGWSWATFVALRLINHSRHPGKRHFYMAIAVIACGLFAEALFTINLLIERPALHAIARNAALWLFLVPTFFSISHRVIPAFTRMAVKGDPPYQPLWMLPAVTAACLGHFLLEVFELPGWLWLAADLPLLVMAVWLGLRWSSWRHVVHPLIGIHHLSFAWLSVALLLFIVQSLGVSLGLAPLHALVSGYFGSMLLGMASRVVIAHSGGPIVFPLGLQIAFVLYQAVPLLRIGADLPGVGAMHAHQLYLVSGAIWVLCWIVWLRRMWPLLWRLST